MLLNPRCVGVLGGSVCVRVPPHLRLHVTHTYDNGMPNTGTNLVCVCVCTCVCACV